MDAYELAKAQQAYSPPTLEEIIKQQADRIAELEAKVDFYAPKSDEGDFKKLSRKNLLDYIEYLRECVDTPQTKPLSDAIKIIEELRVDADMNYKDYESTYADGWDDAFNEILSALYERHGIK